MGTRKSARLAAVCIGAATFVAAVPVLCAELQQVGSQEAADMEDAFETTAQQTMQQRAVMQLQQQKQAMQLQRQRQHQLPMMQSQI